MKLDKYIDTRIVSAIERGRLKAFDQCQKEEWSDWATTGEIINKTNDMIVREVRKTIKEL